MLLREVVAQYVELNPRITSKQTVRRYYTTANTWTQWLERPATTEDLTPDSYARWINHRRKLAKPGTVRGDAEKTLVLWKWAFVRGYAVEPNVLLPKKSGTSPDTYTDAEIARLWDAARGCTWSVGTVPGSVFWPPMLQVIYETSERITPVHASKWTQYDLERRCVSFPAEDRKTPEDFVRPLTEATCVALERLQRHTAGIAGPFCERTQATVRKRFELLLAEAQIPPCRRKRFHGLRSRCASDLTAGGANASLHLGHTDPRVTHRHYIDPKIAQDRAPLKLLYGWQRGKWWRKLLG